LAAPSAVSIVVVTYQSARFIDRCLESIEQHAELPTETIVVDNGSEDGTSDIVRSHPEIRFLPERTNRGFTAAVNLGAAEARAPYMLLLNPDAELLPDALPTLHERMEKEPRLAACGPSFIYPDGSPQDGAFTYPTLLMTWLEFFPRPGRLLHTKWNGRVSSPDGHPIPIDYPLGACVLIRRAAWADVGGLDEGFFMYCEEVDWCMRAKRRGWRVELVPRATVKHYSGGSAELNPRSIVHLYASRRRLHRKHRGPLFRFFAALITRIGLVRERARLRTLIAHSAAPDNAAERLAAINRVLRGASA
jgi:N-acetylglucosaminyl-diphospho-decaprenol L-rhamnosyltransferase